ncbi:MAG: alkaline phosphatase D family protein [Saprospiraceae bacterium]
MRFTFLFVLTIFIFLQKATAQEAALIGLPMIGAVTQTTAEVLVMTKTNEELVVKYWSNTDTITAHFQYSDVDNLSKFKLYYFKFQLKNLKANTKYQVFFYKKNLENSDKITTFRTAPLKNEIKDFAFQIGSCAAPFKGLFYFVRPYNRIFDAMTEQSTDFMIWMGDNVYYLLGEWNDYHKMIKKNLDYRTNKKISRFLNSRPQYAIWDDHDFGPNDSEGHFKNKDETLDIFKKMWANGSYGLDSVEGVFSRFSYSDADFFILDTRYNRKDSIQMFGQVQMNWLKFELKNSTASFKFIVSGTQVLALNRGEHFENYPEEKANFMDFLKNEGIEGVIFLSGDTHYAELTKIDRKNTYPLYEMTSSALTSAYFPGGESHNPYRVPNTFWYKRNFGKIKIEGASENRICHLELYNKRGELVWNYSIKASDLKNY